MSVPAPFLRASTLHGRLRKHAFVRMRCASAATARVLMLVSILSILFAGPANAIPPDASSATAFIITRSVYCNLTVNGSSTVQWASLSDWSTQYYGSDNPLNMTAQMVTSPSGAASIIIQSPANLVGSGGHVLDLTLISLLGSFNGNLSWKGSPYVPLVPSGSATLWTMSSDLVVDATFNLFFEIDDRNLPIDTWTSSGFTLVATAT
jgi:hypothetical protein